MRSELAAILLSASVAWAQPSSAPEPNPARIEFQKAKRAYDLGQFSEALSGYSEAYRLDPRPALLFNIAQCHRQLGEWERAAFFFHRYLSFFPDRQAPNEELTRELLAEVEKKGRVQQTALDAPVNAPGLTSPHSKPDRAPVAVTRVEPSPPLVTRWWFWTGVGAVVTAGVVAGLVVGQPHPRGTSLPPGDLR